ncbi:MAG: hypothetical protein WCO11_02795 [Sphingomonadales bacterium]|jgi:hypothetical protein
MRRAGFALPAITLSAPAAALPMRCPDCPRNHAAFAAIDAHAAHCIAPWPDLSINGPLLRANLGIALFRGLVAAR